ncbi:TetR-like C-terminal domain-containing protein [Nocardia sp. NPDC004711]
MRSRKDHLIRDRCERSEDRDYTGADEYDLHQGAYRQRHGVDALAGTCGTDIGREHHDQEHRQGDRGRRCEKRNQKTGGAGDFEYAAPAHHFGNRQGLFTELAIEGYGLLEQELHSAAGDFGEMAVAYIRFARRYPGHFDIMFRRDLLDTDDERLIAANEGSGRELRTGVDELDGPVADQKAAQLAAWSLVHGFAALWRAGTLIDSELGGEDPEELARRMVAAVELK